MEIGNVIVILGYTFLTLACAGVFYKIKRTNPVFWFLVFEWVIAVGTLMVVDLSRGSDTLYVILFFLALLGFTLGAYITTTVFGVYELQKQFFQKPIEDDAVITKVFIVGLVCLSLLITALYYYAVGYNLFVDVALGREVVDFKSARLASYSGEEYYAPGYVNQFKNILLPIGLYVICAWLYFARRKTLFWMAVMFVIPVVLYSLLGTGQRAPMIYSFIALLFGVSAMTRIPIIRLMLISVGLVMLFGVFSVMNGRMEDFTVTNALLQFGSRVFINDQHEGLVAFRYLYETDLSWFSDWVLGFMGLMPGHKGSHLTHELFFLLHGTDRGTAGITGVGSVFHNGGAVMVPLFYFLLGATYVLVFRRFLSGRRTVLRTFAYGALFFILAIYVSGPPVVLVNKGLLAVFLLLIIRKLRVYPVFGSHLTITNRA